MSYMSANTDVWFGYTYFAGGPWLGPNMYTIEPTGLGTATVNDQPQMSILLNNLLSVVDQSASEHPPMLFGPPFAFTYS